MASKRNSGPFSSDTDAAAQMMGWLPVRDALKQDLDAVYERAQALTRMARSENTRRAYKTAWAQYEAWCQGVGAKPLSGDPGTVALYLAMLSHKVRPSTLKARLAAISVAHRLAGVKFDTAHESLRLIVRGAVREKGLAPSRQARPLHYDALPDVTDAFGDTPVEIRNRALLLLGFAGALRRSEIVAVRREHIRMTPKGLTLTLPRSKTDRRGHGEAIFIARHPSPALCPVGAMEAWLSCLGDGTGPLFPHANRGGTFRAEAITPQTVNRIIKEMAERLGLERDAYSGHSLRAGLATSAADAGCDLRAIMAQTRLRSARQAMTYIRDAERQRQNVTSTLFGPSPAKMQIAP
ncbi:MAG: integrase [Alphaproteobacteria bacterium]|nr:MAG: integrase [Alphaproteobacteria bacterium]